MPQAAAMRPAKAAMLEKPNIEAPEPLVFSAGAAAPLLGVALVLPDGTRTLKRVSKEALRDG